MKSNPITEALADLTYKKRGCSRVRARSLAISAQRVVSKRYPAKERIARMVEWVFAHTTARKERRRTS